MAHDRKADEWHLWELEIGLRQLWNRVRNRGETPSIELEADLAALGFQVNFDERTHEATLGPSMISTTPDGTKHVRPDVSSLSRQHLEVWKLRASQLTSPFLRARYADLIWNFTEVIDHSKPDYKCAELAIDSAANWIEKAKLGAFEARELLGRALAVADQIKSVERQTRLRNLTVKLDAAEPLGGFLEVGFNFLVVPRRIEDDSEACKAIIEKLEGQLDFYAPKGATRCDPFRAEIAAERLIRFYARKRDEGARRRTIARLAEAFLIEAAVSTGIRGTHLAQHAEELLREGGLSDAARDAARKVREFSKKIPEELSVIEHKEFIPNDQVESFLAPLDKLDLSKCVAVTVRRFIPSRSETEKQITTLQQVAPITFLMGHDLIDHAGLPVARVGGVEDDARAHLIRHTSDLLQFDSFLVALSIQRMSKKADFTLDALMNVLAECPLLEDVGAFFVKRGIRAHLEGNYIESIHVLMPQIEQFLRRVIEDLGGNVLCPNRTGGFNYRLLNELIHDPIVERVFGGDAQLYLQTLLSDQRGWNLRNRTFHGLARPELFQESVSARVIHALFLVLAVRLSPSTE